MTGLQLVSLMLAIFTGFSSLALVVLFTTRRRLRRLAHGGRGRTGPGVLDRPALKADVASGADVPPKGI